MLALLLALAALSTGGAAGAAAPITVIRISGAIDVPSQEYLERGLAVAEASRSRLFLVVLNTPGGLGDPMEEMTRALLNAPLPTVVYVAPAGAHAWSAGAYIALAANVVAMHPATTIGAAHPVSLFGGTPEPQDGKGKSSGGDVMTKKVENAFAGQAKVIAAARDRNVAWAERAVRESITASAEEAVRLHVVELTADSVPDLLAKLEGRRVVLPEHRTVTLHLTDAPLVEVEASAKERFLHVLADPNMLLILLALAALGIMFELQNPGAILPGVVGGVALLLALYSLAVLPVSYAGVGLILFAIVLFIADIKVTSHGILTIGGIVAFIMGALMLTDTAVAPGLRVAWQVAAVVAVLMAAFFLFLVGASVRAHLRPVQTGREGMLGRRGKALEALAPTGEILVEGELWRALAVEGVIGRDEEVEVVGEEELTLLVRRRPAG